MFLGLKIRLLFIHKHLFTFFILVKAVVHLINRVGRQLLLVIIRKGSFLGIENFPAFEAVWYLPGLLEHFLAALEAIHLRATLMRTCHRPQRNLLAYHAVEDGGLFRGHEVLFLLGESSFCISHHERMITPVVEQL